MAWEREYHHVDLDEGSYEIGLIERSVLTKSAKPARYLIKVLAGAPTFEHKVGHNTITVKLGGHLAVQPDGSMKDSEGNEFDPAHFATEMIARLDAHHNLLRAVARKHGAAIFKPLPNARM